MTVTQAANRRKSFHLERSSLQLSKSGVQGLNNHHRSKDKINLFLKRSQGKQKVEYRQRLNTNQTEIKMNGSEMRHLD